MKSECKLLIAEDEKWFHFPLKPLNPKVGGFGDMRAELEGAFHPRHHPVGAIDSSERTSPVWIVASLRGMIPRPEIRSKLKLWAKCMRYVCNSIENRGALEEDRACNLVGQTVQ